MAKLAALSSSLLARKGQARPAMRPQGYAPLNPGDDLGWNDMGAPAPMAAPPEPAPAPALPPAAPLPPVLIERAELAREIVVPAALPPRDAPLRPVSVATATRLRRETSHAHRAAFTLRLDADRHLRLRLASALSGRSAQALMTEALAHMLDTLPEVEALVAQLPPATRQVR